MTRHEFWTLTRRLVSYAVLSAVTFRRLLPAGLGGLDVAEAQVGDFRDAADADPARRRRWRTITRSSPAGRSISSRAASRSSSGTTPAQFFMRWFVNSVIVTLGSTLISITISTLAAYSLTRFRYWGRTVVPYFSLLGYMVPSIIFVFPLFLVMVRLDLTDSLLEPRARLRLHHAAVLHVADVGLHALDPDRDRGGGADRRRIAPAGVLAGGAADRAARHHRRGDLLA